MFYFLREEETLHNQSCLESLATVEWAVPLIEKINEQGGICFDNMPLLFELRFAAELNKRGLRVRYETPGLGDRTIDFEVQGKHNKWLIELVSIQPSDASKKSIHPLQDLWQERLLYWENVLKADNLPAEQISLIQETISNIKNTIANIQSFKISPVSSILTSPPRNASSEQETESEEGEMLCVQSKICEKVKKFPAIENQNIIHIILTDMRGYLNGSAAFCQNLENDYLRIAYGKDCLEPHEVSYWRGQPILGLFEPSTSTKLRDAGRIQRDIHMIGFIVENQYNEGEVIQKIKFAENLLFANENLIDKFKEDFGIPKNINKNNPKRT